MKKISISRCNFIVILMVVLCILSSVLVYFYNRGNNGTSSKKSNEKENRYTLQLVNTKTPNSVYDIQPTSVLGDFVMVFGEKIDQAIKDGTVEHLRNEIITSHDTAALTLFDLVVLRKTDIERYYQEAVQFLKHHNDRLLVADVLQQFAQLRNEEQFKEMAKFLEPFGASGMLEASTIAEQTGWLEMSAQYARLAVVSEDASFIVANRSAEIMLNADDIEGVEMALNIMEKRSDKRYQQEACTLLKGKIAVLLGNVDDKMVTDLEQLSINGMMPPVRRDAALMLEGLRVK